MRALLVAAVLLSSSVAHGDAKSEAILLFDQGIKEMKAGQYDKACNSFERSIATYPDSGTKGSLARCYEKLGRLASSWKLWRELADLAPSADLRKDAGVQAARLEPKIARYVVKLTNPPPDLSVTINGQPTKLTDTPVPIDAGGVIVRAYAPNKKDWSVELAATDGNVLTIEVPELQPDIKDTAKPIEPPPPPPPAEKGQRGRTQRLIGLTIAGVGAIAVGTGAVFGLKAGDKFDEAKELCGGDIDACGNVAGAQPLVDDARKAGNVSTMLFIAGGAAIATGIVIFQIAPRPESKVAVTPLATPSTAGVVLTGRF